MVCESKRVMDRGGSATRCILTTHPHEEFELRGVGTCGIICSRSVEAEAQVMRRRFDVAWKRARAFLPVSEPEFIEGLSWSRRPKVRSFLRALSDPSLACANAKAQAVAVAALEAKAGGPSGVIRGRSEFEAVLEAAQQSLIPLQEVALLSRPVLDVASAPTPAADDEASAEGGTTGPPEPVASPVGMPPPTPPDPRDLPDPPDQVLEPGEQLTLASLRLAFMLQALPSFWVRLSRARSPVAGADGDDTRELEVGQVAELVETLGTSEPCEQLRAMLQLTRDAESSFLVEASPKELRAAAIRVVEATQPFSFELLRRSKLLQPTEEAHIDRLDATPAALSALMQKRSIWMRMQDLIGSREPTGVDESDLLQLAMNRDPQVCCGVGQINAYTCMRMYD